jgi:hypothetical protein
MSRSQLPQSDADRIAVATTTVAIAAILWVILAVVPNPRDVSFATAQAATARHVDEVNRAAPPARSGHSPAQLAAPHASAVKSTAGY